MNQNEFLDEQIIDMLNQVEEQTNISDVGKDEAVEKVEIEIVEDALNILESGIKVQGKRINFERQLLAKQTITMMVPTNFSEMSQEMARIKYPSEHRPETILTDGLGVTNLMFQYMDENVSNDTIEQFRNQVFGMMKRVNPGLKEREIGALDVKETKIAYVEFSNNTMDGKLYNLMFYLPVDGKPLMGSFNCQTKEMKYWREPVFEMLRSIEIINEQMV